MKTIFAIPFLILSVLFTLLTLYCIGMAFIDSYAYAFVAAGVFLSDLAAIAVTLALLRS